MGRNTYHYTDADKARSIEMCEWLARECTEHSATPSQITERFGWAVTQRADAIRYARGVGLAAGNKKLVQLTYDGLDRFDARESTTLDTVQELEFETVALPELIEPDILDPDTTLGIVAPYTHDEHTAVIQSLHGALKILPKKHAMFLELLLSAVVARDHYANEYPSGHPGFMAIGNTGSGKTAIARFLCTLFGFNDVQLTLQLRDQTKGNLIGRRMRSGESWDFTPPPEAMHPFLFIDEWSFGDDSLRNYALKYFQSDVNAKIEGKIYRLLPVPMLASNYPEKGDDRYSIFPVPYRRRSIVFDTSGADRRSTEKVIREFSRRYRSQIVDLARVPFYSQSVSNESVDILSLASLMLTTKGDAEYITDRTLEILMRGYCTLFGAPNTPATALRIVNDYLSITSTVSGHVVSGWKSDLVLIENHLDKPADILAEMIGRNQSVRNESRALVVSGPSDVELIQLELEVAETRGVHVAQYERILSGFNPALYEGWDTEFTDELSRICGAFRWFRDQAQRATSVEKLSELMSYALLYQPRIAELSRYINDNREVIEPEPEMESITDAEMIENESGPRAIDANSNVLDLLTKLRGKSKGAYDTGNEAVYACSCGCIIDREINGMSNSAGICPKCQRQFA